MLSLINLIISFLGFIQTTITIYVILDVLLLFGVLSPYGRIMGVVWPSMRGLFEPTLQFIRRIIPPYRGFDWSLVALFLLIQFISSLLQEYGPLAVHSITSTGVAQ